MLPVTEIVPESKSTEGIAPAPPLLRALRRARRPQSYAKVTGGDGDGEEPIPILLFLCLLLACMGIFFWVLY